MRIFGAFWRSKYSFEFDLKSWNLTNALFIRIPLVTEFAALARREGRALLAVTVIVVNLGVVVKLLQQRLLFLRRLTSVGTLGVDALLAPSSTLMIFALALVDIWVKSIVTQFAFPRNREVDLP